MLTHASLVIHYKLHIFSVELLSRQSFLILGHAIYYSCLYVCTLPAQIYYVFQPVSLYISMVLHFNAALCHSSGVFWGDIMY